MMRVTQGVRERLRRLLFKVSFPAIAEVEAAGCAFAESTASRRRHPKVCRKTGGACVE
jgi:hypothetical protein